MAIMKCPECSKDVSDQAKSCPGCGFPIKGESSADPSGASNVVSATVGFWESLEGYSLNKEIVCSQCGKKGCVMTKRVRVKKGVSGAKVTGALFTGGLSILATGLSRKEWATAAKCKNCKSQWHF